MHYQSPLNCSQLPAWLALQTQHRRMASYSMQTAFASDPQRFTRYSIEQPGLLLDYSKNLIDDQILQLLLQLAEQCRLPAAINAMFHGEPINSSEDRPALHIALRRPASQPLLVNGSDVVAQVHQVHTQMQSLVERIHNGQWLGYTGERITDVVNIGIGGSFLGPRLVTETLQPFAKGDVRCHFLANIDSSAFHQISQKLDARRSLFIISSKSFGTLETLKNAQAARQWFLNQGGTLADLAKHFIAISSNVDKAIAFGIAQENILPMWNWVGGRYSLWSAIGLPIALSVGMDNFKALLAGAWSMDEHFRDAPLAQNMPVIMALLGIWYINFWRAHSHAVLPYDDYLKSLPAYLQQLDMESNGKQVRQDGSPLNYNSGPVIWGDVGTNGQHAYHQLLLQGTHMIPADFIVALQSQNPVADHHQWLYANCLSQSQALMRGKNRSEVENELRNCGLDEAEILRLAPHKEIPGNRPSNTLIANQLDAKHLGALIALYEHKVFVQSVIWGNNAFDQWGVELGKELGETVYQSLSGQSSPDTLDSSTRALVNRFQRHNAESAQ